MYLKTFGIMNIRHRQYVFALIINKLVSELQQFQFPTVLMALSN